VNRSTSELQANAPEGEKLGQGGYRPVRSEEEANGDGIWWVNGMIVYHQGQLNYLQLAYGDENANIPPEWGRPG
jgi:hypothetical protein